MERRDLSIEKSVDILVIYSISSIKKAVRKIIKYETPKTLAELGVKSAPQSFVYLR